MAQLFTLPKQVPIQSSGVPYAGAKLYFYCAGTTTDQDVFTDYACTIAHSQPVTADANGVFAAIYLDPQASYDYRVQVKTSAGALIYDQDNLPRYSLTSAQAASLLTQAQIGAILYPTTAAEMSAGVTPVTYIYPELNLLRYGATTESSNNATAISNAVAVASVSGGTISIPAGTYKFASFPSLNSKQGIIFQGVAPANSGLARGAVLCYTGTASPVISCSAAQAIEFRDLQIIHNNASFTGTYIRYGGGAAMCGVRNCFFGANVGAGCTHLDLDATQLFIADRCQFFKGNPAVKGQASSGSSYSNVVTFRDCEWYYHPSAPVVWGGESWSFSGCTFEARSDGIAGAFDYGSPASIGLAFNDCWFGDVTVSGGTWIAAYADGLAVNGCRFGGSTTSTQAISMAGCKGVSISGNSFDEFSVAINFADALSSGIAITGNVFTTVTNAIGNSANVPADAVIDPNTPEIVIARSFTATLSGMTATTTGAVRYAVNGKTVTLEAAAAVTGTSNAATMTLSGLPAALTPANNVYVPAAALTDNGALVSGIAQVRTDNTIVFGNGITNYSANAFTTSGTKGLGAGFSLTYQRS